MKPIARPTIEEFEAKLIASADWTQVKIYSDWKNFTHSAGHTVLLFKTHVHVTAHDEPGMAWPTKCVCWHVAVRLYARQYGVPDLVAMLLPCQPASEIPALVAELHSVSSGHLP
jgi:hypothetical protein